jgi:hypothetical protein
MIRQASLEKCREAKRLIRGGMVVDDALAKMHLGKMTWYKFIKSEEAETDVEIVEPVKRTYNKRKRDDGAGKRLAVVFGSPQEVADLIARVNA